MKQWFFRKGEIGSLKVLIRFVPVIILGFLILTPVNAAEKSWDSLLAESTGYFEAEKYQKALNVGTKVLTAAEKLYGPDHLNTAISLLNLAKIYHELGNYNNSESYYLGALKTRERVLGREHPRAAACYYGLAEILTKRGEYQLAENYAGRALSVYQKTNGPTNVEVGNIYIVLAGINLGRLQYQEAESMGTKALETLEKAAGPESLATGKALLLMAALRIKQEKYTDASALLQRADAIYLKIHRKKPLDTGKLFYYQAEVLRLQGEPKKAQGLYKKALKYFEKRSKSNPDLGNTLIALATCRKSDLKYKKAEELQRKGLSALESCLGSQSIILEEPIQEMAELLVFNRSYEQAGTIAYQLLKIREQKYGTKDLKMVDALNRLAGVYLKTDRINEAEYFGKQAVLSADLAKGAESPERAGSLILMAKIRIRKGDYLDAKSDWEQASGLIKQLAGKEPLLSVQLQETEALLHIAQGNYLAAEPVLQQAVTEAEQVFGPFHTGLAELLKQLSALYKKEGRLKDAEAVEKRIKKIYSKVF